MRRFVSLVAIIGIALSTSAIPLSVSAASEPDTITGVRSSVLTRGEFVVSAVKALKLSPVHTANPILDNQRINASQLPYIRSAYDTGALDVFGTSLALNRTINRGEALQVLLELGNMKTTNTTSSFSDVRKGSKLAGIVNVAIEKKWIEPISERIFGTEEQLTRQESAVLLQQASLGIKPATPPRTTPGIQVNTPVKDGGSPSSSAQNQQLLDAVWKILQKDFYYKDKLKQDTATLKAAEAIVNSVGDPYTVFMPPAQTKSFNATIFEGNISGIGAQVEHKKDASGTPILTIVTPLRGSPAEKAGVKPGDEVLEVNGESLEGLTFDEAVNKIRGPRGTVARLLLRRQGKEVTIEVTRDNVSIPELDLTYNGTIAIIKLQQFGKVTNDKFRDMIASTKEKNVTGIILDVRSNPGGLVTAAEKVVSAFVPEGEIFSRITAVDGNEHKEYTTNPPVIDPGLPVIVLINKGSASASEIVAGALQDLERAKVVGQKSFGKGTVQTVYTLNSVAKGELAGSSLKVTTGEWKTPDGRSIDKHGVEGAGGIAPDVEVMDSESDPDASLRKALELLR